MYWYLCYTALLPRSSSSAEDPINIIMTSLVRISLFPAFLLYISLTSAFSPTPIGKEPSRAIPRRNRRHHSEPLYSGKGVAPTYSWLEECFDIEITVNVPKETRASDISFRARANSIDLRLQKKRPEESSESEEPEELVLLDPSRKLRGRVVLDGTYWIISDPEVVVSDEDHNESSDDPYRVVTVTIEKQIRTPKDDFDVVEYDWNGVYEDDEDEVSYRKYDEPQELDVRDYAASMGVDIDNIDMNLVDKSMFTSGLNVTKSTFDNMKEAGLMTEVTEQTDGSEWTIGEDGEKVPFSSMGQGVSKDEMKSAKSPSPIPFLDNNSPWHTTVPLDQAKKVKEEIEETSPEKASTLKKEETSDSKEIAKDSNDPIDTLTVAKLKEVLRSRGLKVSGNKKELQERLRAEVQSMLQNNDE